MFIPRSTRLAALALGVALASQPAGRAEPTGPIPQPAKERYSQAEELERQGKLKEAVAAYQEAIRLGMQLFPRAHLKEADGYLNLNDFDGAIARYTKVINNFGVEDSCRS